MVGFSSANIKSFSCEYICTHCLLLLRDPVQLIDCGHRFCQSCTNEQECDMIVCSECHVKTSRKNLIVDRGFKNDMQTLLVECSLCSWTDVLRNYQVKLLLFSFLLSILLVLIYKNHLHQTHPNPLCNYCGEKLPSVNDLDRHKQNDCAKITVDCPLKEYGCQEMILRINLSEHYRSEQHQNVLMNVVRHLKSISSNAKNSHSQMAIDSPHTNENVTVELQEIFETTDILMNAVEVLSGDLKRLGTESICYQNALDPLTQELALLKTSIQEQNSYLDGTKINQQVIEQDLASIGQKVDDMKTTSFDGSLTWKIDNVKEKLADAQSEKQTSIYSAPFYSSPTGYKMRVRLYLYGDGNARRTHVSLFFVLMRGEHDAILKFPFNFKVTFCLYDQGSQHRHIVDSFRPDIKSDSFQRPRSDMNIASGVPKFVPLAMIQQDNNPFINDDTMFIKVMIDFNDIPKTMLSYALSVNPGLPTPVQQLLVRQEIERQQQSSTPSITNPETTNLQQINPLLNIPGNVKDKPTDPTNDNTNLMMDG